MLKKGIIEYELHVVPILSGGIVPATLKIVHTISFPVRNSKAYY